MGEIGKDNYSWVQKFMGISANRMGSPQGTLWSEAAGRAHVVKSYMMGRLKLLICSVLSLELV